MHASLGRGTLGLSVFGSHFESNCYRSNSDNRQTNALADQRWFLSTLRDEGAVAKRLMRVLGTSAFVPDLLLRAPEVIQQYADGPQGPVKPS